MVVTGEADVTVLLWVVFIGAAVGEALVLGVDLLVVVVLFVETPGVVIFDVTGFTVVVLVLFVETEVTGLVDGFVIGFMVVPVLFWGPEETGVGFTVLLVCGVLTVRLPLE